MGGLLASSQFIVIVVSVVLAVVTSVFVIIVIAIMVSRALAAGVSSRVPGWEWSPCFWAFWQWHAGMEKAGDQLIPIFFDRGFVNPIAQ
jgi:hypothetical protein